MGYYHPMNAMVGYAGDPGFGKWFKRATRVPKAIRKFQPGRALGRLAPLGALIPGPIGGAFRLASTFGLAGDPGFFDFVGKAGRAVSGWIGGGGASRAASQLEQRAAAFLGSPTGRAVAGGVASGVAGAALGAMLGGRGRREGGRRYRRIDPLNVHALNRSIRRIHAFNKLYRAAHAPTGMREIGKGTLKTAGVRRRSRRK